MKQPKEKILFFYQSGSGCFKHLNNSWYMQLIEHMRGTRGNRHLLVLPMPAFLINYTLSAQNQEDFLEVNIEPAFQKCLYSRPDFMQEGGRARAENRRPGPGHYWLTSKYHSILYICHLISTKEGDSRRPSGEQKQVYRLSHK
jgi:hypothetical protein